MPLSLRHCAEPLSLRHDEPRRLGNESIGRGLFPYRARSSSPGNACGAVCETGGSSPGNACGSGCVCATAARECFCLRSVQASLRTRMQCKLAGHARSMIFLAQDFVATYCLEDARGFFTEEVKRLVVRMNRAMGPWAMLLVRKDYDASEARRVIASSYALRRGHGKRARRQLSGLCAGKSG